MRCRKARFLVPVLLAVLAAGASSAGARDVELPSETFRDWRFYNDAGWRCYLRGDYPRAEERFNEAIRVLKPYEASQTRLLGRSYLNLALALVEEGRVAEAEPLAKWALAVREWDPKVKDAAIVQNLDVLVRIDIAQRRYDAAKPLLERLLSLQERQAPPNPFEVASTLDRLAALELARGDFTVSEWYYRRALALAEKDLPPDHIALAEVLEHYAALLRQRNRGPEAERLEERAETVRAAAKNPAPLSPSRTPRT